MDQSSEIKTNNFIMEGSPVNRSASSSSNRARGVNRRELATEAKTPAEYTLHILFTQFVRHAERKLNVCLNEYPLNEEPPIGEILSEGADPSFDRIIASLGHIAKSKPKPVIDSVMFWRKSKSEVAIMAASAVDKNAVSSNQPELRHQLELSRQTAVQAERKSLISIYILCRTLIEIVQQTTVSVFGSDLCDKLEDVVYSQLKTTDPTVLTESPIRFCNWNIFAQLLGIMSEKRFVDVSDRFIADLEKFPLGKVGGNERRIENQDSLSLLIHGMQYLKLRSFPLEDFEESAEFIKSVAKFFQKCQVNSVIVSYCEVLSYLLLPLASVLTAEVNHPTWVEALEMILEKTSLLFEGPLGWVALNLHTAALSVAPREIFQDNWVSVVDLCLKRTSRPKTPERDRVVSLTCISRLVWVYVYRLTESLNSTTRQLEKIVRSVVLSFGLKGLHISSLQPAIQLCRIIGVSHTSFALDNVFLPLMRLGFNGMVESINYPQMSVAVQAYLWVLQDLGGDSTAPFPNDIALFKPTFNDVKLDSSHEEVCRVLMRLFHVLDGEVGARGFTHHRARSSGSQLWNQLTSPIFGDKEVGTAEKNLHLFSLVVQAVPLACSFSGIPYRKLVGVLCRNCVQSDGRVAESCIEALKEMVARKNAKVVIIAFAQDAFKLDGDMVHSYVESAEYLQLLHIWGSLLEVWLDAFRSSNESVAEELELKNVANVLDEVEGYGLLFVYSHDFQVRRQGLRVLRIVAEFDKKIRGASQPLEPPQPLQLLQSAEPAEQPQPQTQTHQMTPSKYAAEFGTRLTHVLSNLNWDFFDPVPAKLSSVEKTRLGKLRQTHRKSPIEALAESEYGVDSALWFRQFPKLVSLLVVKCPMQSAIARSCACVRLVQFYDTVASPKKSERGLRIVKEFKVLLMVACCSLTATNEQRVHVPPAGSQQMLTVQHHKVTSARSVFKMVLPLLKSDNAQVRDGIVTGLACVNSSIAMTLLECMEPAEETIAVLCDVAEKYSGEHAILIKLVDFLRVLKSMTENSSLKFRTRFSTLAETLLKASAHDIDSYLPFEARAAIFSLLQKWVVQTRHAAYPDVIFQAEASELFSAACNCIAELCVFPLEKEVAQSALLRVEADTVLDWVESLFLQQDEVLHLNARKALCGMLKNETSGSVLEFVLRKCYTEPDERMVHYFYSLCQCSIPSTKMVPVGLFAGSSPLLSVRQLAAKALAPSDQLRRSLVCECGPVYMRALLTLSAQLSASSNRREVVLELAAAISASPFKRRLVAVVLPWVQSLESVDETMLQVLFELTVQFGEDAEAIWVALASGSSSNVEATVEFLVRGGVNHGSEQYFQHARLVAVAVASGPTDVVELLVKNVSPSLMVPIERSDSTRLTGRSSVSQPDNGVSSFAPLTFSLGQVSIIFLADLITGSVHPQLSQLAPPLFLHVSVVLLDHYIPVVRNQAKALLTILVADLDIDPLLESPWLYEELNARTPLKMDTLVRAVVKHFSHSQAEWSRVALEWATTCAVRHVACRSFQVFRALLQDLDQQMLRAMLRRLCNTIADSSPEIQGFALQILMTLNAVTAELPANVLIDFPQLFWAGVACLSTVHEREFTEAVSTLSKLISKIDLDSPETVACLVSTFPPLWEGKFQGLQQAVMVGLRSAVTWDLSLRLLDKITLLDDSEIVGSGDSRLLFALLANIPRLLHSLDGESANKDIGNRICELADLAEKPGISRIVNSLVENKFRNKKDPISQLVTAIASYFFPQYEAQTLVFLLGLLSNRIRWVRLEALSMIKHILPEVNLQSEQFIGVGADLISPLLRLLLTDCAEEALQVLDQPVTISGSQLDRDVLRMSLGNRSLRKQYEKTPTLFGVPTESGWAVPMPAITSATTRNNVHAVFATCNVAHEQDQDQQIQFQRDGYAPIDDTVSMHEEQDASLSHMWAALDNLDSFFTKEDTADPLVPFESAPQVYDKKVSVILNRSLARTTSNASFRTSLADFGAEKFQPITEHPVSPRGSPADESDTFGILRAPSRSIMKLGRDPTTPKRNSVAGNKRERTSMFRNSKRSPKE